MRRVRDILLGVLVGVVLSLGVLYMQSYTFNIAFPPYADPESGLVSSADVLLHEAYQNLSVGHVDGIQASSDQSTYAYGAVRGMVEAFGDPYTRVLDPKQENDERENISGEYGGVGMYIGDRDGKTVVISPIDGTPAARAGLKPGDELVKIGETVVMGLKSDSAAQQLRGVPGTKIAVWVRRDGLEKILKFNLVRETIRLKTVKWEMLPDRIAYVRLSHFNERSGSEMLEAILGANEKGAQGMVLDLRNNPGGLLDVCVDIADLFLDGGVVVSTKGRMAMANSILKSMPGKAFDKPVVVLVNAGSASAAEILAGAIKDRHRGTILGEKTFGKGSVQTFMPFSAKTEGGGMFVTIARYYTPSGFKLDKIGLSPDIEIRGEYGESKDRDLQLKKAAEILKKRQ